MKKIKVVDSFVIVIVGFLFIFSGLIKLNDPIGTAIKLEEYFEVFATDIGSFFHVFIPWALSLAVILVVLEVVLGIAVIFRVEMRITTWILLLLILFFTFLTFYSARYNKVTDCGCFGDAISLTPWESFAKDLVLLVLIGYLFIRRKAIQPIFRKSIGLAVSGSAIVICTFLAFYSIWHLPFIDFRPYKVGDNIKTNMEPSEPFEFEYIMEKDGEQYSFKDYPSDTTYKYVSSAITNPEAEPKITDYDLQDLDGNSLTEESFEGKKLFIIFQDVQKSSIRYMEEIVSLSNELEGELEIWSLTSSDGETFENFRHEYQLATPYFFVDATVLKAMIRANPGLILLDDGTVIGKWHYNDIPSSSDIIGLLKM